MAETRIARADYVVTRIDDDGTPQIIEDGAVAFADGVIRAVGSFTAVRGDHPDAEVIGGSGRVLLPGFVNGHHHVGLTPVQLGVPDLPLELWFGARMLGRPVDLYLDTLYAAFEMIASGVTTVQHLRNNFPGDQPDILTASEEILRAYSDIGMRVSYSYNVRDQHQLGYFEDEELIQRVGESYRDDLRRTLAALPVSGEQGIEVYRELSRRHAGDPLLRFQLMPANLHWCSDEALAALTEVSLADQVPIHLHLAETVFQEEYADRRTGGTAVRHLDRLGMLNPLLTLGHGVWIAPDDLDLLAERGVSVCHNASSNLRLASGIAPVNGWLARGLNVGLGMDEAGINDDRDMFQEMRLVLLLHRLPGFDLPGPSAARVLRMATEGGARTTSFRGEVGVLDVGLGADLVLADLGAARYPAAPEQIPLIDLIVQRMKAPDVRTVVIAGTTVYHEGKFTGVDMAAALSELKDQLRSPAQDSARIALAHELLAVLPSMYDEYLQGDRQKAFEAARTRMR